MVEGRALGAEVANPMAEAVAIEDGLTPLIDAGLCGLCLHLAKLIKGLFENDVEVQNGFFREIARRRQSLAAFDLVLASALLRA